MFAVERSNKPGPQGGRPRGFCLAWCGRGYPPHGRGYRSGWYLHRTDAESAAAVANSAVERDRGRPVRPAFTLGDSSHVVRLTAPDGRTLWLGRSGDTPDGFDAVRFNNAAAAHSSLAHYFGNGSAFWNSERASQAQARERFRGWQGAVIADGNL